MPLPLQPLQVLSNHSLLLAYDLASLGIAACNIGGVTVHSFAGIGLGAEPAEELLKKIKKNKKTLSRWLRTKVLIIDEGKLP